MKQLITILLFVFSFFTHAQTKHKSEVRRVTLFANNAQIERQATVTVKPGEQSLIFTGISTKILANTIRVRSSQKDVLIRQSSFKTEFIETEVNNDEAEKLYTALDAVKRELEIIDAEKSGLLKEREFLNQNSSINGSRGLNLSLAQFQQMGTYFKTQMQKTQSQLYDLEVKRNAKKEKINALMAQLKMVTSVATKTTGLIEITLDAKKAESITLTIDYLVNNAGWRPEYEMRVSDVGAPIILELKAKLYQETEIDWKNVELSFSTGDPQRGSQAPVLNTWYITQPVATPAVFNNTQKTQRNQGYMGRFTGIVKDSETGEGIRSAVVAFINPEGKVIHTLLTGYDGSYSYLSNNPILQLQYAAFGFESQIRNAGGGRVVVQLKSTSQKVDDVIVLTDSRLIEVGKTSDIKTKEQVHMVPQQTFVDGVKVRGSVSIPMSEKDRKAQENFERIQRNASQVRKAIAQRYIAKVPYNVPATGKEISVSLQELKMPVSYRYFAAPKADADAFLEAQLFRWDTLGLVSGDMKIFVEGNYVGNSKLDAMSLADTLNLSLGRDPNVVVKRTTINGETSKSFFGGKTTQKTGYRLEARNNKKVAITLYFQDQYPLSPSEDIVIKRGTNSGGKVNPETGVVTWQIELKPGEQIERTLEFEVTYPKGKRVYF